MTKLVAALVLVTVSLSLHAKEVRLYAQPGEFAVGRSNTPFAVDVGDTLTFSNGRRFTVKRVLGGRNNLLLDVGEGKVLRIPMSATPARKKFIAEYASGYKVLVQNGVRVPQVFLSESDPREYILQSYVDVRAHLDDMDHLPADERERAYEQLVLFASGTAGFHSIGDFAARQLAWDGSAWILLDWTDEHILYNNGGIFGDDQSHPFRLVSEFIPGAYYKRILQVIADRRLSFACDSQLDNSNDWRRDF